MERESERELLEEKKALIKKITDNNQTIGACIVLSILFCWTIIAPIIGIILLLKASEDKRKCKQAMVDVDFKLDKISRRH